jgi:two-component system LytT family response regulator
VHLVRGALTRFEARLDPALFVRIHRRTIVRLDRISEIVALGNGDGLVRLKGGAELRASRGFAEALRQGLRRNQHQDTGRTPCA